ncbi:DUF6228 family protein [Streptomyces sp. NPDC050418]|uniref:DUF6228 family protein n=1 Tax=Streptomyces sp. NPDC050418 TaxID=3365612 RepID=UPI0037B61193
MTSWAEATDSCKQNLVVHCQDDTSVSVTFDNRSSFDADAVHYALALHAPGLTARAAEIVAWIWDADLVTFLEELAADYRGWNGDRSWQTLDRDLTVTAVFRSGGHVGLTWSIRPWRQAAGGWSASVTTWIEAGEQMASMAADIRHFLAGEPQ